MAEKKLMIRHASEMEELEGEDEGGLMRIARKQQHVPAWYAVALGHAGRCCERSGCHRVSAAPLSAHMALLQ